jgi:hypothetical protein
MRNRTLFHSAMPLLVLVLLVSPSSGPCLAQSAGLPQVRLFSDSGELASGTLLRGERGFYLVARAEQGDTAFVDPATVRRAERLVARRRRGWSAVGKGAGIGFGIGIGLMALNGVTSRGPERGPGNMIVAGLGVLTTIAGTLVGIVRATTPHDVWEPIGLATLDALAH